jgi:predicted amidohydrolase
MNNRKIRIGMGQILVEGGHVEENLNRAVKAIKEASEKDCQIIVLPECLDCGWTYPESKKLAQPIPGKTVSVLAKAAVNYGIYVVAGVTELAEDKVYNSAVLISSKGELLSLHRKINVLDIAQDIYSIGDRLSVVETEYGKIGLNICADNFEDSHALAYSLSRMGADMILSPSAWALSLTYDWSKGDPCLMWEKSYKKIAEQFNVPVVGVSNVGKVNAGVWEGRECIGTSVAVSCDGKVAAKGKQGVDKEELIIAEIEVQNDKPKGTDISVMLKSKGI